MFINTLVSETSKHVLPGTAAAVVLGQPPVQAAIVNLVVALAVRLTSHLLTKRRARRAARKAAQNG